MRGCIEQHLFGSVSKREWGLEGWHDVVQRRQQKNDMTPFRINSTNGALSIDSCRFEELMKELQTHGFAMAYLGITSMLVEVMLLDDGRMVANAAQELRQAESLALALIDRAQRLKA